MTAGSRSPPASAGFESVPASENPLAGILTCSSFGSRDGAPGASHRRDVLAHDLEALRREC